MSNLKLLTQFATVRLEVQVSANAFQAGTVAVAKTKWVKPGMNCRPGELTVCLLNVTCSNQRGRVFFKSCVITDSVGATEEYCLAILKIQLSTQVSVSS